MQTVNFQCGHCRNLMAVSREFLGQQVRCPHCQQVVLAPAVASPPEPPPAPPSPPPPDLGQTETVMHVPNHQDAEDIFAPAAPSDDLFGQSSAPRIEMPPEPMPTIDLPSAPPPPEVLSPTLAGDLSIPAPPSALDATFTTTPQLSVDEAPPPFNGANTTSLPPSPAESPWLSSTTTLPEAPPPAPAPAAEEEGAHAPALSTPTLSRTPRKEGGSPWFMVLVFSPLLLYSIVVTIFAVMLYLEQRQIQQERRNPFEMMPDEGDNPGVQKGQKGQKRQAYLYKPDLATAPLASNLRTTLGKALPIGDLVVTPEKVERKKVRVFVKGFERPEPCLADSLVLSLSIENASEDHRFAPLDNYFDRSWKPGQDMLPPLTLLEAGDARFFGGPARWAPSGSKDPNKRPEWVEGRELVDTEGLGPGEAKDYFVCTDGNDDKAVRRLFGENRDGKRVGEPYRGALLWRVRLRRGLVQFKNKEYSATAVIGVEFTDRDIIRGKSQES
jgi:hypothetical protein